jgi:glycosyltransferase involved in cell wall biosynthesis
MHGEPQVTVVVPCFRQGHLLAECLRSVCAQTLPAWVATVVDDASPDGAVIRDAVREVGDPRIQLLRQPRNGGLSAARNAGIRASGTPFVICLDADDLLDEHCLERLLAPLLDDPALELAFSDMLLFGAEHGVRRYHVPAAGEILRGQPVPPNALMRRTLWERLGGYDESETMRIGREDWEFYIRAFTAGCRAAHVPEPLYRYRTAAQSMNIACRAREHMVRRYIYEKHRVLFDAAGEGRAVLASGYDRAAASAQARGDAAEMLRLAAHAFALRPSWRRAKQALRGVRLLLGIPGPRMLRERWGS